MNRILQRIRNEPAVVVALLLALANLGFGAEVDLEQVGQLREQILETLGLLLGGGLIRQSVFSRRTHEDEVVDAASHAHLADDQR